MDKSEDLCYPIIQQELKNVLKIIHNLKEQTKPELKKRIEKKVTIDITEFRKPLEKSF